MKSKGTAGTDSEGAYLVRQLMDYADSLLNATNNYVTVNTEWLSEVLLVRAAIIIVCMAA